MTYIFLFISINTLICAIGVILVNNPVHSVLFLILTFINVSILLILLEVDFLAMLFLIVYIGAIAILFLFIIMMLNLKQTRSSNSYQNYIKYCLNFSLFFLFISIVGYIIYNLNFFEETTNVIQLSELKNPSSFFTNIYMIGSILYTVHFFHFLCAGIILLIAMIGAIILTSEHSLKVKRQHVFEQVTRNNINAVCLIKEKK